MELQYRGLKATLEHVDVTDAELDRQMLRLQQQNPRITVVTGRPAQLGDELALSYAGFCEGVQFPGGTAENQTLTLGSHTFIPGFEEQLVGAEAGSDVTVHVTFPAQYHAPELAGKAAEFRCHISEIRTRTAYELDDTFAKEVGQCETLDQMRQKVRQSMEEYYLHRAELELREKLLSQAAATVSCTPTPEELEKAVDEQLDTLKAQLAQRGLTLESYCEFTKSTPEQLRVDARADAEEAVRVKRLVETVARLEGMTAEDKELADAYAEICRMNHMSMEELRPYLDDTFRAAVTHSILRAKVAELLRQTAEITETKAPGV